MFWGHSRGPFGLFTDRYSSLIGSQFAEDDLQSYVAQTLTLRELRVALRNARECLQQNVDIIVFKDCFMSTLETAYELKDSVDLPHRVARHRAHSRMALCRDVQASLFKERSEGRRKLDCRQRCTSTTQRARTITVERCTTRCSTRAH